MSRPDYYSIKMISNSALKNFSDYSPRKALYLYNNGIKETDALIFGRFIHSNCMEPDTIEKEYFLLPEDFNLRSKANKELYQQIKDDGKTPIKFDMQQKANEMMNRIYESKNATTLLKGIPEKEYFGEINGERIKCKVDLINPDKGYILDLKTTLNAAPDEFIKECDKRQYFQQAWLYRELANQNGENITKFLFLNIEKEPPYCMSIVEVSDLQFEIGYEQFNHNLAMYKLALKNPDKDFDSLPQGQKHFQYELPDWMVRKYNLEGED